MNLSIFSRRQFLRTGIGGFAATVAMSCGFAEPQQRESGDPARLRSRPGRVSRPIGPGEHTLDAATMGGSLLYVPAGYRPEVAAPLFLMLHGAGGRPGHARDLYPYAYRHGVLMLAPKSAGRTWDVVRGGFGPDVAAIDAALAQVFERCAVDASRIWIGGFSDGASYALSLGLANGDLFTGIAAFSPGFMVAVERIGTPRVFLSHGTRDTVLPIDRTGRRLARQLAGWGYDVTFREFDGPHTVPAEVAEEAFGRIAAGT